MTLAELNFLSSHNAHTALFECCGSVQWVNKMLALRPFATVDHLRQHAEREWWRLDSAEWLQAFAKHPQIGARHPVSAWSSQEQSGMQHASADISRELQLLNCEYVNRFGWTFIVCATGKSAEEMRAGLKQRLGNDAADELRIAAAEQVKIIDIRLRKLIET